MEVEADSGLEQGYSRESSGNDNTGPTSIRRPPHPQLLPSSDQPDVVQTSVAVTTVAKDSEDNSVNKDCNKSEAKSGNGSDENDYVEYPR